jgi:hypothetical protein
MSLRRVTFGEDRDHSAAQADLSAVAAALCNRLSNPPNVRRAVGAGWGMILDERIDTSKARVPVAGHHRAAEGWAGRGG